VGSFAGKHGNARQRTATHGNARQSTAKRRAQMDGGVTPPSKNLGQSYTAVKKSWAELHRREKILGRVTPP